MESPLLTERQAAEYLQLTARALQAWRGNGHGPRFVRISCRCVRYRKADLDTWLEERLARSTSDTTVAEREARSLQRVPA